ncbi:MAG: alpha-E domain-containing protein [Actinomyces sp.]|nr:alpha-E domain-containing protein [Actinomyces sp.]
MLSRIAESLFWIGRYLERTEDTARLLKVHLRLLIEDPLADEGQASAALLSVMGIPVEDADTADVLRFLCHDPFSTSSIISSIQAAHEAAHRARETVPDDQWEILNRWWRATRSGSLEKGHPTDVMTGITNRCAMISGMMHSQLLRDEGWWFLMMGRNLERVDMTARVIRLAALRPSPTSWSDALSSCAGQHAYIRSRGAASTDLDIARFLLLDESFPRSLLFSLDAVAQALDTIDRADPVRGHVSEATRLVGQTRSRLLYRAPEATMEDLSARMAALGATCAEVSACVQERFFEGTAATHWTGDHL